MYKITVKEFVEAHIDQIDNNDWYDVFSDAYHIIEQTRFAFDINEFIDLMTDIDPNFLSDTYVERKKLIDYYIEENYTSELHTFQADENYGGKYRGLIFYPRIISNLHHYLGFTFKDINKFIDESPLYGKRVTVNGRKAIDVRDLIWM